jgi:hypothetical protein
MQAHGLFEQIAASAVHFLPTRQEKIACLQALCCTHFIDDLEETFLEPTFPSGLEKILFAPRPPASPPPGVKVARSWKQICEYTFHARC